MKDNEREKVAKTGHKSPLFKSFKTTLSNRPFLVVVFFSVLFTMGTSATNGLGAYLNTYYVHAGDQSGASVIQGIAGTLGLTLGILSLPLYDWISRRIGKTRTMAIAGTMVMTALLLSWYTYTPKLPYLLLVSSAMIFTGNAGLWMLFPSMVADVVDGDELKTKERREGSFASVFSWVLKVSTTIGIGLSGPILQFTGFAADVGEIQPAEVLTRMRVIFALVPSAGLVFALLLLSRYPLSARRMKEIRNELEERRGRLD